MNHLNEANEVTTVFKTADIVKSSEETLNQTTSNIKGLLDEIDQAYVNYKELLYNQIVDHINTINNENTVNREICLKKEKDFIDLNSNLKNFMRAIQENFQAFFLGKKNKGFREQMTVSSLPTPHDLRVEKELELRKEEKTDHKNLTHKRRSEIYENLQDVDEDLLNAHNDNDNNNDYFVEDYEMS
ncbi:hypothetical protein HDU92_004436 [Lobulomyces angularis]|nr:hypothetical protein HDU92_004436 [Lobulomyces angularis]